MQLSSKETRWSDGSAWTNAEFCEGIFQHETAFKTQNLILFFIVNKRNGEGGVGGKKTTFDVGRSKYLNNEGGERWNHACIRNLNADIGATSEGEISKLLTEMMLIFCCDFDVD